MVLAKTGFCYGGHPACWASSENADIACGVVCHPSMQLEKFAFGGDCDALLKSVRCPYLIMPAGNDLPNWGKDGDFGKAFLSSPCAGQMEFVNFPEMTHGWT